MIGRALLLALVTALISPAASAGEAIAYLESLKGKSAPYIAPSDIDPRFTMALYVNVATKGANKQRMWMLERESLGSGWRLSMWDEAHWKKAKLAAGEAPPYSWPVSSGRGYPGDKKSGPTPPGVYGIDERKGRYGYGWMQDGMINVLHIDYHYAGGRMSGVAFHGTTAGRYRRLGTNDSHGCIRMHQKNALRVLDRLTGRDKALAEDMRWGEIPRFWRAEKGRTRMGYVRDGSYLSELPDAVAEMAHPSEVAFVSEAEAAAPAPGDILVKTGFRALAVIFMD